MTDGPFMPALADGHWLERLDVHVALRLLGRRTFDLALASTATYGEPPIALGDGQLIRAAFVDGGRSGRGVEGALSRVEIQLREDDAVLVGDCSRCFSAFGPCLHMGILAIDLASSKALRRALELGQSTESVCDEAVATRQALHLETNFDSAFGAWIAPAEEGVRLEIAATPFSEETRESPVGRAYGERDRIDTGPLLSVTVRRAGQRKLVAPREMSGLGHISGRERRVLTHTRERGTGRKTVFAWGVAASLAIEAMREHGGIFAAGFKGLLEFRSAVVRPAIEHGIAPGSSDGRFEALRAFWTGDGVRMAFDEVVFFPGPFPFVWSKSGAIYRVGRDVDLDMARQLTRNPVLIVPRAKLEEVGVRLIRAARGRGIQTPRSEIFGLPPLETPRFVLRLAGEPLIVVGELVAHYPSGEVPIFGPGATHKVEPPRDADAEDRAAALLDRVGLVKDDLWGDLEDGPEGRPAKDELRVGVGSEEQAVALWQKGILELRASEDPIVEIELSEKLARVKVGPPIASRVHVVLEGNWLDTRLEFSAKDLPVEIDAIREALARQKKWVALSDGTLTRISSAVESLVEEAELVMGEAAEAKLPAHQLGRLERWIEENDGRMDAAVDTLRKRLRALSVAAEPDMPSGLTATLRPYQKLGLAWLQFLRELGAGGILADDMGLGKTITALAFLLEWKEREGPAPSLVVCPTSVATNWAHEAKRFTPGLRVHLHQGSRAVRAKTRFEDYDVVVTTYALLRLDVDTLDKTRFRTAVLDEAQYVKNADAATRSAAGRLDASMRLALSGTPVENRLRELWSIASFVNPGMLGSVRSFEKRYERTIAMNRTSPLADELRAIVRPFLLRRTKDDVLRELPPKTEINRFVTLSRENKRLYDALALMLRESVAKDIAKRGLGAATMGVFTALTRLRQMACEPRLVDPRLPAHASAKREAFLDLVRELVSEKRRALVFSQFVKLLTLWRIDLDAEGIAYEYLDGATTKRDEVVRRFQEGTAPLFLISLKAGGAGLNLTAADTVIHCDPWWNPAVEDQATDRAYRIGQDKPVTVVRLVASGTIEDKIGSLKEKKRELVKAVIDDDAGALAGIGAEELRMLLGDADTDTGAADSDDEENEENQENETPASPTDIIATATKIVDADYEELVREAQRWLATTGGYENELASLLELPVPFVTRLAKGEPFPCSRAVADRIRTRLLAHRRGLH